MKVIFGCGKSGISVAGLCEKKGIDYVLYDSNEKVDVAKITGELEGMKHGRILLGEYDEKYNEVVDEWIISPGVPVDHPLLNAQRAIGKKVIGEIEFAFRYMKGKLIAITGTNGKTTTTALTGKLVSKAYKNTFVVGNIGTPFCDYALKTSEDSVTVAEISSFQLETIESFHADVSAILNLTPDHLNRHYTMENYFAMKKRIANLQTKSQKCILNYEDEALREDTKDIQAERIWFSSGRTLEEGMYLEGANIVYAHNKEVTEIFNINNLKIIGVHNHENAMAAILMALAVGVSVDQIREGLAEFNPVEHRIEYVATKNGVKWYNDSKGTNTDAAIKAIKAMKGKTLLIAGGYDKNSEYDEWIDAFDEKVKYLVLIGQTKEKIADCARKHGMDKEIVLCETYKEALDFCKDNAFEGETVLLSPACASWGMFSNYEQRGDMFKEYVHSIKENA